MIGHSATEFKTRPTLLEKLHVDLPLFLYLIVLFGFGLMLLFSANEQKIDLVIKQVSHFGIGLIVMYIIACIPVRAYQHLSPFIFIFGLILLIAVLGLGETSKGAQRWLRIGPLRFQPMEVMKIALPMMLAWFFCKRETCNPSWLELAIAGVIIAVPVLLIAKQPDLGSSLLVAASGVFVVFFAGISYRKIAFFVTSAIFALPILWMFMHDYQRQRVMTFLNPEADPLGSGWNIIQSKIAIGSGGIFGKGWLNGTQVHLEFLPEKTTDFIFAVCSEEFGLLGVLTLFFLYLSMVARGLTIGHQSKDFYSKLFAGSISLTLFTYAAVNVGMVSGLLPVVGLPLPFVSYGGTSLISLMGSLGFLMAIRTHRMG